MSERRESKEEEEGQDPVTGGALELQIASRLQIRGGKEIAVLFFWVDFHGAEEKCKGCHPGGGGEVKDRTGFGLARRKPGEISVEKGKAVASTASLFTPAQSGVNILGQQEAMWPTVGMSERRESKEEEEDQDPVTGGASELQIASRLRIHGGKEIAVLFIRVDFHGAEEKCKGCHPGGGGGVKDRTGFELARRKFRLSGGIIFTSPGVFSCIQPN
ncbi:hypothetical protein KSP39_PZI017983 [Platanthera zijinensis]|uniref:Uncharacterized protein n=1 Tax=Platanthera zijinensis TaxID=2320716 RepID=A0AAP0B4R3_9ASPA